MVNINLSGINSTSGQASILNTGDIPTTSTGLSLTALGRTVYLDQVNGNDTTGVAGSSLYKFATIQAALTAATSGDVILASPGTYTGAFALKNGVAIQALGNRGRVTFSGAASWTPVAAGTEQVMALQADFTGGLTIDTTGKASGSGILRFDGCRILSALVLTGRSSALDTFQFLTSAVFSSTLVATNCTFLMQCAASVGFFTDVTLLGGCLGRIVGMGGIDGVLTVGGTSLLQMFDLTRTIGAGGVIVSGTAILEISGIEGSLGGGVGVTTGAGTIFYGYNIGNIGPVTSDGTVNLWNIQSATGFTVQAGVFELFNCPGAGGGLTVTGGLAEFYNVSGIGTVAISTTAQVRIDGGSSVGAITVDAGGILYIFNIGTIGDLVTDGTVNLWGVHTGLITVQAGITLLYDCPDTGNVTVTGGDAEFFNVDGVGDVTVSSTATFRIDGGRNIGAVTLSGTALFEGRNIVSLVSVTLDGDTTCLISDTFISGAVTITSVSGNPAFQFRGRSIDSFSNDGGTVEIYDTTIATTFANISGTTLAKSCNVGTTITISGGTVDLDDGSSGATTISLASVVTLRDRRIVGAVTISGTATVTAYDMVSGAITTADTPTISIFGGSITSFDNNGGTLHLRDLAVADFVYNQTGTATVRDCQLVGDMWTPSGVTTLYDCNVAGSLTDDPTGTSTSHSCTFATSVVAEGTVKTFDCITPSLTFDATGVLLEWNGGTVGDVTASAVGLTLKLLGGVVVTGTATSAVGAIIDATGADMRAATLVGPGAIDRLDFVKSITGTAIGLNAIAFTVPFSTAAYYVTPIQTSAAGGTNPAIANKTVSGFDLDDADGTRDFDLLVQRLLATD